MSGTVETTKASESLWEPRHVIALAVLGIAAGTIAAVFVRADPPTMNVIASLVIGTILGSVTGYYFGASKSVEPVRVQSRNPGDTQ